MPEKRASRQTDYGAQSVPTVGSLMITHNNDLCSPSSSQEQDEVAAYMGKCLVEWLDRLIAEAAEMIEDMPMITHYDGDDCPQGHRETKKRMGVSGRSIKTQENRRQYARPTKDSKNTRKAGTPLG